MTFSRRLAWSATENRLARAVAAAHAKAHAAGRPLLDLTESNPTRVGLGASDQALHAALAQPGIGAYEPAARGLPVARAAVAADFARRGCVVAAADVCLTASSSESYAVLAKLLGDPGDVVLAPEPSYPLFEYLFALEGVRVRPYRLGFDGAFHLDAGAIARAADAAAHAGESVRAVVVVSPHNPTGATLDAAEAAALDDVCAARGLPLIVDEVFADFARHARAAGVLGYGPRRALTFALGGLSKSCGLPQMKVGWLAVGGPEAERASALSHLELVLDTYLSVSTPAQLALPRLLDLGAGVRERIGERVARNRAALARALVGAPASLVPPAAGWAQVLRVPATRSDEEWALALVDDDVLVQPGYFFDLAPDWGAGTCLVVSLLPAPEVFDEAVARLGARLRVGLAAT